MRIAARRGRARACVALARKLAGILYAMWRDGTEFNPQALRRGRRARDNGWLQYEGRIMNGAAALPDPIMRRG